MKALLWLLLLELVWGCAMNRPSHWPDRGALVTVINDTPEVVAVVAHSDARGGIVETARLWPQSRITFRWPWIDSAGQLLATPWFANVFAPWDADYWCWHVSEPTIRAGKCA